MEPASPTVAFPRPSAARTAAPGRGRGARAGETRNVRSARPQSLRSALPARRTHHPPSHCGGQLSAQDSAVKRGTSSGDVAWAPRRAARASSPSQRDGGNGGAEASSGDPGALPRRCSAPSSERQSVVSCFPLGLSPALYSRAAGGCHSPACARKNARKPVFAKTKKPGKKWEESLGHRGRRSHDGHLRGNGGLHQRRVPPEGVAFIAAGDGRD